MYAGHCRKHLNLSFHPLDSEGRQHNSFSPPRPPLGHVSIRCPRANRIAASELRNSRNEIQIEYYKFQ